MPEKRIPYLLIPVLYLLSSGLTAAADVPHLSNTPDPAEGEQTLRLAADWQAGGADDDIFFGVVGSALTDADGNIYLLDSQLAEVHVYSPTGEHLRVLSREGDGPGEVRRPSSLLLLPGPKLGITMGFPGKIVVLDLNGAPDRSITPGNNATGGGFNMLIQSDYRADRLAASCASMSPGDDGFKRTVYLATFDAEGNELVRFAEKSTVNDLGSPTYIERDEYFVDRRWAIGPDGRIYTAPVRDKYEIHVQAPDGTLERIFDLPHTPYKRTAAEKEEVGSGIMMIANGRRLEVKNEIEDYEPCIESLRVDNDGNLVVRHSRSARDLPEGIFLTQDVFDPQGKYLRRVSIACEGDPQEDRLLPLEGGRYLLVRGLQSAQRAMRAGFGGGGQDEAAETEEANPLEVVCLSRR